MAADGDKPIGLPARCLGGIAGFSARRPRLVLWLMMFLGCAAVAIAATRLELRTSRADLLAPEQAWEDYESAFGGSSELVVVVKTAEPNEKQIRQVLDRLAERLRREPEHFSNVLYRIDQSTLRRKALQYLTADQLRSAIRRVNEYRPVLERRDWDLLRLELLAATLEQRVRTGVAEQKSIERAVDYADRLATSLSRFLEVNGGDVQLNTHGFRSPWPELVTAELEHTAQDADVAYLMDDSRRVGILHVSPARTEAGSIDRFAALERLREHVRAVESDYQEANPGLRVAVTGIPVLEQDELHRTGRDVLNAAGIAFAGVALLLWLGLRSPRHPMFVMISLVMALAITTGIAAIVVGHLNILSICFAAVLIGLGVDFGIHYVTRYLFVRQEVLELEESLIQSARTAGTGIITSALTTSVAFASAVLTGYPGLAELGLLSAIGILVCAVLSLTFLPALIALADAPIDIDELPEPLSGDFWNSAVSRWPVAAIATGIAGLAAIAWFAVDYTDGAVALRVGYDANLLRMQDPALESVQAERLLHASEDSLLYAVAVAQSRSEADSLRAQLLRLPTVARVNDLSSQLPPPPTAEQKQLIQTLKASLTSLPKQAPQVTASRNSVVGKSLDQLYKTLKSSGHLRAHEAAKRLDAFLNRFSTLSGEQQSEVLDAYQNLLVASLLKDFSQVTFASSVEPVSLEDLPEAWRNRYLRTEGDRQLWLLKIYPKEDVWDEAALAAFVNDIRTVDAGITGIPVRHYEAAVRLRECYQVIALYSLVAIALFLLFDFLRPGQKLLTMIPPLLVVGFIGYHRLQNSQPLNLNLLIAIYVSIVAFVATVFDVRNLRDTLVALIPAVGGGVMLLGLMAILGIDFNPLNLIVLPLVLGIGVDDGVHLVHDYRRQLREGADEYQPSGDTLNAVMLTSLTSIIGFGSLMISAHVGLQTMGVVIALGIACCMAVALVLVPPVLVIIARYHPASFEPVVVPKPRKAAAEGSDNGSSAPQSERRMSRKERRRMQQQQAQESQRAA